MMKLLYFCVCISGLIGQGQAFCEFTPNVSKACLDFWTFTDMTHGCLNEKDKMKFSGLRKTVDGEYLISVNTTDMNTGNIIAVWVRKADGHCTMNCCDRKTNQRRLLLDQLIHLDLKKECEHTCHEHAGSCTFVGLTVLCHCNGGYSGHHCEKEEPCHNVECQHGANCSSGLCSCVNGFTGQHCEIMMPATTVKSIQTTQTTGQQTISAVQNIQSTLTAKQQTIPALTQCVDEQFVNCQDPDICQSPFSGRCPLSCKLCVPITTQEPCADSKFVNCQDHMVCSSPVSQYCPVSCGTCGSKSTMQVTTAKTSTATG